MSLKQVLAEFDQINKDLTATLPKEKVEEILNHFIDEDNPDAQEKKFKKKYLEIEEENKE